ncbi:uncharacterized protein LOC144151811 [Haemaphysalis longicornis]
MRFVIAAFILAISATTEEREFATYADLLQFLCVEGPIWIYYRNYERVIITKDHIDDGACAFWIILSRNPYQIFVSNYGALQTHRPNIFYATPSNSSSGNPILTLTSFSGKTKTVYTMRYYNGEGKCAVFYYDPGGSANIMLFYWGRRDQPLIPDCEKMYDDVKTIRKNYVFSEFICSQMMNRINQIRLL